MGIHTNLHFTFTKRHKRTMSKEQIWSLFCSLANSQGFYGRLCERILDAGEEGEAYMQHLEDMNFKTELDVILYIEE